MNNKDVSLKYLRGLENSSHFSVGKPVDKYLLNILRSSRSVFGFATFLKLAQFIVLLHYESQVSSVWPTKIDVVAKIFASIVIIRYLGGILKLKLSRYT